MTTTTAKINHVRTELFGVCCALARKPGDPILIKRERELTDQLDELGDDGMAMRRKFHSVHERGKGTAPKKGRRK